MAEHRCVYGFWHQDGLLVCVRRVRGPSAGQLDLPGGPVLAGEDLADALARHLREQCGVRFLTRGPWGPFDLHLTTTSTGEPVDLRHRGCIAQVEVEGRVAGSSEASDVRGDEGVAAVELVDVAKTPEAALSPVARQALAQDAWGWRG